MPSRGVLPPDDRPRVLADGSYIYGFVTQEVNLPFKSGDDLRDLAGSMEALFADGAYPHLAEFIAEHALAPGYDYRDEFAFGLDLILDGC